MARRCVKYYENDFITALVPIDIVKTIMEKYKMLKETDLDGISPF